MAAATTNSAIGSLAAAELATEFRGPITGPEDPAYEDARKVWNASIDKRPALIVRPTGVADVIAAVRFARERQLLVAIRGGAHSIAGHSTCDDGLVIDLSDMKGIRVDPDRRRAHVQPGVLWKDLDRETQAFGLAVTGGLISSTGVAGFTLGGGIGWLQRRFGLACDNLIAADVVTADGEFLRASDSEDGDLLWALRGGGGNFGIVTSFEFELHPVGPEVLGGLVFFPGGKAAEVLTFLRDFHVEAPDGLTIAGVLRLAPPAPFLPEEVHGRPVVAVAGMYAGDIAEARLATKPLRDLGSPIVDLMVPRRYTEMQSLLDASWTPGFQNYWKAEYLSGMPDGAIDVLIEHLGTISSPLSDFKFPYLGGAIGSMGEDDTAYGHRDAPFILNINTRWSDPEDSERHIEWTRALWSALQPYSGGGTYTNFMSADDAGRVRDSYGPKKYARLVDLKRRYDPSNFFRLNQNVPPAEGS
jgi:FAD/FMN-containing dehydrogenase